MNQKEKILMIFRHNNNSFTLGYLFQFYPNIAYKFTSRVADLRKDGYDIICDQDHGTVSKNRYTLIETDSHGQQSFL